MTAAAIEQEVARALSRGALYRLLADAFAYPTAPRLADLAERAQAGLTAAALSPEVRTRLAALRRAAGEADVETLAGEHVFLFDRQVRCPPWEEAWGAAPQMAGKGAALADIAGFYAAFGLAPEGGQPATEDHLVAELEFMSALAVKEAWALASEQPEAVEVTRQAQRTFLTDHLGRWAARFAEELSAATPLPFYVAAAGLLADWVAADAAALGATPEPVVARRPADSLQQESFDCPLADRAGPPGPEGSP